ncbi:ester cyclase [Rhodocytophaga rosea]|uniref:Ester cyclase n=1 Tax=Rhodocytophaga rosea TaxID=2704465 RepID=A0A6C0GLE5_9BACT|nr:ester cyclase [Rhodocytophaga rosea]QHT68767.1 ester cyclase [Rhodocytophaga rosea]
MENLLEKISDLNTMIVQGKILEAFEKYYHEEVIMQENETEPRVGKAANRAAELDFLSKVTQLRHAHPLKVTAGQNTTMVEWHFDYTHADWGIRNYTQVSVQEWKEGQIITEKFYYPNA